MVLLFMQAGCNEDPRLGIVQVGIQDAKGVDTADIEFLSIDYPHGETSLTVWKDGQASLFYGALPQREIIKSGTFNVEELYKQLHSRLRRNVPREDWPNPNSTYGMVQVTFKDKSKKDYLIFNEHEFTEQLFSKARKHIVGKEP